MNEKPCGFLSMHLLTSRIPKLKRWDVARTIPIFAETTDSLEFVPSFVKMESVENHPELGRSSIRSSKAKPLNYCLANQLITPTNGGSNQRNCR